MSRHFNIFMAGWLAAFSLIHVEKGNAAWVAVLLVLCGLNIYAGMRR